MHVTCCRIAPFGFSTEPDRMCPETDEPEDDRVERGAGEEDLPEPFVVTTELDLHGVFPEQAPAMLEDFLLNAREKGYPEVKIIHGKGRSTMKRIVLEFLEGYPGVESYRDAWDSMSGWGATIVRLRDKATG